jgi:hypothetical protein
MTERECRIEKDFRCSVREREQCLARLHYLEDHHQGIGREAELLRRRLLLIEAVIASGKTSG